MKDLLGGGKRIAFFGGSFDPPHLGHLAIARAARAALALDAVLFAPVGAQPLKPQGAVTSFEDRMAMTRLAIANEAGFGLSLADAPRHGGAPNYTLETLLSLRAELAGGSLFCLMGADSFLSLHHWWRAAEIPFVASLMVASRPGERLDDLRAALPAGLTIEAAPPAKRPQPIEAASDVKLERWTLRNRPGAAADFYILSGLHMDVSASEIREQVRASADAALHKLLPAAVADYIRQHDLYR